MVNRLKLLEELKKHIVFTSKTINDITRKEKKYSNLILYRLKKTGYVNEIERDKYTTYKDPFLIASRIVWPSYMSGWTALQHYNLTEQIPQIIEIVTTRSRKMRIIIFMGVKIEFSRIKQEYFFAYEKIDYGGHQIFMAKKEKALLDALFLKHISPQTFMEIIEQNRKKISIMKLKHYAGKMPKSFFSKIKKLICNGGCYDR
jgi:predicted transcriptional regulator of viral defense system